MVYSVLLKAHVSRSMEKEQIDRQTDTLTHTHTHTHDWTLGFGQI